MGVKRFDLIESIGGEAWLEEASLGEYVKSSDYDAMEADRDRFERLYIQGCADACKQALDAADSQSDGERNG